MKKLQKYHINRSIILMTSSVLFFCFPQKVKAEWYVIGHDYSSNSPIYLDNQSVFINGEVRSGKVDHVNFGRAIFTINCRTDEYYLQSNQGRERERAVPGTIAGVIAEEICSEYFISE
ncbi:MAG: hypothetical protein Tsb0014_29800 [Pleurocapsa sp.]